MKVGYARISSKDQNNEAQIAKLAAVGCDKIFEEKMSGTLSQRPVLKACLDYVREGDFLCITRLDRFGRNVLELLKNIQLLETKGVGLLVTEQSIDTTTPTGRLLMHMLCSIAEFETELRAERQMEGIANAREKGVMWGRKSVISPDELETAVEFHEAGVSLGKIARDLGVGRSTLYRHFKRIKPQLN